MKFMSPLRYPGGKAKMAPFLAAVISALPKRPETYAEPYAGGAGAALHLLDEGVVERIAINDLNRGVAAFWSLAFLQTDWLVDKIWNTDASLAEWHHQREIYLDPDADSLEMGFATFYLNRTNRSGILGARPIGGLEQTVNWKIDARYNRNDIVARLKRLAQYQDRVTISAVDGREFLYLNDSKNGDVFFYVDPPYLKQGEDLYLANMTYRDHVQLAGTMQRLKSPWVLTYDHDDRVPNELYAGLQCAEFTVSHTASKQHVGTEYLVVPPHVKVESLDGFGPRVGTWLAKKKSAQMP